MSIYKYLILLCFCTGLCWVAWFSVIFMIEPSEAGLLAFLFFYSSLGFALVGTFSSLGVLFRWKVLKDEMAYKHVRVASRQAVLFALSLIAALVLQSQRYLNWWNLVLIIVAASLIELFFISYKRFNK